MYVMEDFLKEFIKKLPEGFLGDFLDDIHAWFTNDFSSIIFWTNLPRSFAKTPFSFWQPFASTCENYLQLVANS